MQPPAYQPSPFVQAAQLNTYVNKQVVIAGKVVSADATSLVLEAGAGHKVNVRRGTHPSVPLEPGMNVLVRGLVNPDLSVAESNAFPSSDLGERFDLELFNEAAAVTCHVNCAHIFGS